MEMQTQDHKISSKSDDEAVSPFACTVASLLQDARSGKLAPYYCDACEPIFPYLIGQYEDHSLYDGPCIRRLPNELNESWEGPEGFTYGRVMTAMEEGYICKIRTVAQLETSALKDGCEGCRLMIYSILDARARNGHEMSVLQTLELRASDLIQVHIRRWYKGWKSRIFDLRLSLGPSRTLNVFQADLIMVAEMGDAAAAYVDAKVDFGGTESLSLLKLLKGWLDDCCRTHSHGDCSDQDLPMPSRVLDVSSDRLRLLHTGHKMGRYAALSYCWGGEQPCKLTSSKLKDYSNSISEAAQPKTIRDAVKVCRAVGLDYLWVDAYCIVQDCEDDKAREIEDMANVYERSFVTISGSNASCVDEGFLRDTTNLQLMPLHVQLPDSKPSQIWLRTSFEPSTGNEAIDQRAWALQEQILSRRIISFPSRDTDLYLKCSTRHQYDLSAHYARMSDKIWVKRDTGVPTKVTDRLDLSSRWQILLERYMERSLSDPSDRLSALAGMAIRFAEKMNSDYCAGLWMKQVASQLLWSVQPVQEFQEDRHSRWSEKYVAPSWSWASVLGPVRLHCIPSSDDEYPWDTDRWNRDHSMSVYHCERRLANDAAPFGRILEAKLTVSGSSMEVLLATPSLPSIILVHPYVDTLVNVRDVLISKFPGNVKSIDRIGAAILDDPEAVEDKLQVRGLFVLRIPMYKHRDSSPESWKLDTVKILAGLLLVPAGGETYRRIGMFHLDPELEQHHPEDAKRESFVLV